jgi:hypothetical protein
MHCQARGGETVIVYECLGLLQLTLRSNVFVLVRSLEKMLLYCLRCEKVSKAGVKLLCANSWWSSTETCQKVLGRAGTKSQRDLSLLEEVDRLLLCM